MSLVKGSRYEGCKVFVYKDEKGRSRRCLDIREPISLQSMNDNVKLHRLANDREWLDILAIKNGANREELWYLIADINSISKPINMTGGDYIYIPLAVIFMRF